MTQSDLITTDSDGSPSSVQRAHTEVPNLSKQPRNMETRKQVDSFFSSTYNFALATSLQEPAYATDSRRRDKWLRHFWKREPHLGGVIKSVLDIDKNRGWSVTGGRNQVNRVQRILHSVENGAGWRYFMSQQALSYYATDIGSITELGRDGEDGPLRTLYHVDSARSKLNKNRNWPLSYYPVRGRKQDWSPSDYYRVTSIPSDDEKYLGLGWCAVSRALEFAKIMVAVFQHDAEELGARAMEGLLILNNIDQDQWADAMKARDAELDAKERRWFNGVAVLAASGADQLDAKLVALSSLPSNFDRAMFVEGMMLGYALIFGYDVNEFWSTTAGTFGRGTESVIQARKASGKGSLDFVLGYQDMLQSHLPDTIHFEFDSRNPEGDLIIAEKQQVKQETVTALYESGLAVGQPLISREEARTLLAEAGIIPEEWTAGEEDVTATDVERENKRLLKRFREESLTYDNVWRAAATFPTEPIIRWSWDSVRGNTSRMLWLRGDDIFQPSVWPGAVVHRQDEDGEVLFDSGGVIITEGDVDKAIATSRQRVPELFELLTNVPATEEEEQEALAEIGITA